MTIECSQSVHSIVGIIYKSICSSAQTGTETDAPFLDTAIADACAAIERHCSAENPFSCAIRKYPVKVSPAAVVSTACTFCAGQKYRSSRA